MISTHASSNVWFAIPIEPLEVEFDVEILLGGGGENVVLVVG